MQRKNINRIANNIATHAFTHGMTTTQYCATINAGNMTLRDAYRIVTEAILRNPIQSFAEGGFRQLNKQKWEELK